MLVGLTRRHQHVIALVFVGLLIATVAWRGFDVAWNGAMLVIILVFGVGHTAYLAIVQQRAARRPVTLVGLSWPPRAPSGLNYL